MKNSDQIKELVKEKYGEIAVESQASGCCSTSCCGGTADEAINLVSEDYQSLEGYAKEADLGLGCGVPTQFANLKAGETVVDLGSGAGNDCFVARAAVGSEGKVIGLDMTGQMVAKARENAEKLGYNNVEFRLGEIENMPITDNTADVILSNCVLNLVPDKQKAFEEIYRITKPGGRFCISDIVVEGTLPPKLLGLADLYIGCVAGAIDEHDYLQHVKNAGFINVEVKQKKKFEVPDELIQKYLSNDEFEQLKKENVAVWSITVVGDKK